ncbi:hypothetical protein [Lactobacillus phage Lbab1]|nr:hypothetical protein [Lactobacillus phage Lbab1]
MVDKDELCIAKSIYNKTLKGEQQFYLGNFNKEKNDIWNDGWQQGIAFVTGVVSAMVNHPYGYDDINDLNLAIINELNWEQTNSSYEEYPVSDDTITNSQYYDGFLLAINTEIGILKQAMSEFFDYEDVSEVN